MFCFLGLNILVLLEQITYHVYFWIEMLPRIIRMIRQWRRYVQYFSHSLKSNYPGIIVDVISILHRGIDTNGIRVNPTVLGNTINQESNKLL
jgi:hypothetical protein